MLTSRRCQYTVVRRIGGLIRRSVATIRSASISEVSSDIAAERRADSVRETIPVPAPKLQC